MAFPFNLNIAAAGGGAYAPMGATEGLREFMREVERLGQQVAPRVAKSAARAAMGQIAKALKAAVMATDAPMAVKREARRTIAARIKRDKKFKTETAKIGFGVGRDTEGQTARREKRRGGHGGVGIGKRNIHWFVLGTGERYVTGMSAVRTARKEIKAQGWSAVARHRRAGHPTGLIRPYFAGAMQRAVATSQSQALAAARTKIEQLLSKEKTA